MIKPMARLKVTQDQMNGMLMSVEYGFRQCEKGKNLEATLASVFDIYEVKKEPELSND